MCCNTDSMSPERKSRQWIIQGTTCVFPGSVGLPGSCSRDQGAISCLFGLLSSRSLPCFLLPAARLQVEQYPSLPAPEVGSTLVPCILYEMLEILLNSLSSSTVSQPVHRLLTFRKSLDEVLLKDMSY